MFESMSLAPYSWLFPYVGAFVYVYFFPTFIALLFNPDAAGKIWFTNTLIGWTGAGWIGCLVWAFGSE